MLSADNIELLKASGYEYIIGTRIKNESAKIKQRILSESWASSHVINIDKNESDRIIVSFSANRAKKDACNRRRGLSRLEKNVKSGNLTKSNINNRGYNKYLKMVGDVKVEIDYGKYNNDSAWDGLKGYLTNTNLSESDVIENYNNLWYIERAFRISKTDLQIKQIFHRLKYRIENHICISFTAYCIYKELE